VTKTTTIIAKNHSQIGHGVGENNTTNVLSAPQSLSSEKPPKTIERDQFDREVYSLLGALCEAKSELSENYEGVRTALRRLNSVDLAAETNQLSEVQAKLDQLLSEADKSALKSLRQNSSAVVANLVSSAIWQNVIAPLFQ